MDPYIKTTWDGNFIIWHLIKQMTEICLLSFQKFVCEICSPALNFILYSIIFFKMEYCLK
jgi:hypothetical protein